MAKLISKRPLLLITGTGGGMGAACARVLARRYRLVLTELRAEPLEATPRLLKDDGADIVGEVAGDISSGATIATISDIIDQEGDWTPLSIQRVFPRLWGLGKRFSPSISPRR